MLPTLSTKAQENRLSIQIDRLDESYQTLANEIYHIKNSAFTGIDDPDVLIERFNQLNAQRKIVSANRLIDSNLQIVIRYADDPAIVQLTDSLLKQNERQLAEKIYGLIENSGNQSNLPYLDFTFAKYYARHRQWQAVNQLLEDIFTELSGDDVDYAYLLQGSAQQHLKRHRKSVDSYGHIPPSSPYYVHAQLNTALASIRQDWITEARSIIEKIIPVSRGRKNNKLTNRIYLVLGYALLQKEYFRDARKAFRSIDLNSQYTNRALMGISLTAISQGDYVGGLNAVNRLKQKQGQDLSDDEAFLVLPYIYEKLEQPLNIEASFSESIDHYQARLLQLSRLKRRLPDLDNLQLEEPSGDLVLDNIRFDFNRHYPRYLLVNRRNLYLLANEVSRPDLLARISTLSSQYDQALHAAITTLIEQHIGFITSYLNQSRFGLARYYDNHQMEGQ